MGRDEVDYLERHDTGLSLFPNPDSCVSGNSTISPRRDRQEGGRLRGVSHQWFNITRLRTWGVHFGPETHLVVRTSTHRLHSVSTITLYTAQDGDYNCSPEVLTGGSQIVSYKKATEMSQLHCFQPRIKLGTCSTGEPACDSLTVGEPETDTLIDQLSIVTHRSAQLCSTDLT